MKSYYVYIHINLCNSKKYVGLTSQLPEKRFNNGKGYHGCTYFKNAINKYGWENFAHEVVCSGLTKEEAEEMERTLVSFFRTNEREYGYNLTSGGETNKELTEEARRHLSESHKGYVMPQSQRDKISEANRGENSPMYGKSPSEETRRKISKTLTGRYRGKDSPNYGKHLPEEVKEKVRATKIRKGQRPSRRAIELSVEKTKGVPLSEEHRRKISEARKGMKFTEEHRRHLSEVRRGRKLTEETKRKISLAEKGRKHTAYQDQRIREATGKPVKCMTTGEVFDCIREAAKKYGLCDASISNCCNGKQKTTRMGNGVYYTWCFI